MKKKSQIFRNKLELGYILDYFLSNFTLVEPNDIKDIIDTIDISLIEQRCSNMIIDSNVDSSDGDSYNVDNSNVVVSNRIHLQLNKVVYRKLEYHNKLQPFVDYIRDFYYKSKKNYAVEKITFKSFVTIIRQICKYFGFTMSTTIHYTRSTYDLKYDILIEY